MPSVSGGLSNCRALRRGNGRLKTLEWRKKKKKSMVPVRFSDLSLSSRGTSSVCFVLVLPLSLQSSRFLSSPSLHPSSSLMTELLASDRNAAFSRLISTLNSPEKDWLCKMLNWTLNLSLTLSHIPPAPIPVSLPPSQSVLHRLPSLYCS